MALGGGTYTSQNKELPGAYINFVSAASANASLSERGIATMPLKLDWGIDNEVFEVTAEDFMKNSLKIFGYPYTHKKMKGLRDLFLNARTLYTYKLTSSGTKASNVYAQALYSGVRGNDLKIVIEKNADDESLFDIKTLLDNNIVDVQTVESASELVANDFVSFAADAEIAVTSGTPLESGTNGTVDGTAYQTYLDKIESFSYNAMGVTVTDETTKAMFAAFAKRLRDEIGVKFQLVLYNHSADYYGVVNVKNKTLDEEQNPAELVYWVTGACAGCEVNKSNQNKIYDGEFGVDTSYTQSELKKAIKAGEFTLHQVGTDIRVLDDVNSMTTVSEMFGEDFKSNQTIRVIDQIANDIAVLFNTKYLGTVPNDEAGRISLWSDIVKHHQQLAKIRAIENFSDSDVIVSQGETKKSVVVSDAVTAVNAMSKLYMTVTVS